MKNEITEQAVLDWLLSKYTELREDGAPVDHLEIICVNSEASPQIKVSAYHFPKSGGCHSGHRKPTILEAVAALQADIRKHQGDPLQMRKEAKRLLDAARGIDGKPVHLTFEPDATSASAEAQNEGRLMPKARPNPHDA